jgi:predicted RecB family endonuclease
MVQDLSYLQDLASQPSEDQEQAVQNAVNEACINSIVKYLTEIADTMESNSIESLNTATIRAMAQEMSNRLTTHAENQED